MSRRHRSFRPQNRELRSHRHQSGPASSSLPSAEPSFAAQTRGTVPLVAQRAVSASEEHPEPAAAASPRDSVTVTPLVDPSRRTADRNWADQSMDDEVEEVPVSPKPRSRTPPPLKTKPPPQCIRDDPAQRPRVVEGPPQEFLPMGFFIPPGPPKPPPPPPASVPPPAQAESESQRPKTPQLPMPERPQPPPPKVKPTPDRPPRSPVQVLPQCHLRRLVAAGAKGSRKLLSPR